MLKFPQINKINPDKTLIAFADIPYAKHNRITKTSGKQIGFLTEHTLFFILHGKKQFHFADETVTINSKEMILLKRGIYTVSEQLAVNGHFEALMIFLPEKLLKKVAFEYPRISGSIPQNESFAVIPKNELLADFESHYLNYFESSINTLERLVQLKLQEIILLLMSTSKVREITAFIHSCVKKQPIDIEFIVKQHLLKPLSIADFARLSSRSIASFKRDIQKLFNTPPKQWINRQRLFYANTLLNTTNKTIADIAFECGFESASHFIKIFKKEFGDTPHSKRAKSTIG